MPKESRAPTPKPQPPKVPSIGDFKKHTIQKRKRKLRISLPHERRRETNRNPNSILRRKNNKYKARQIQYEQSETDNSKTKNIQYQDK